MSKGFLLDTHALLWWFFEAERLSYRATDIMADGSIDVFVSPVSAMEIATKYRIGKLPGAASLVGKFVEMTDTEGFKQLVLTADHAELAGSIRSPHGDPWDRLLAAQATIEQLTLVSSDAKMSTLGVKTYW